MCVRILISDLLNPLLSRNHSPFTLAGQLLQLRNDFIVRNSIAASLVNPGISGFHAFVFSDWTGIALAHFNQRHFARWLRIANSTVDFSDYWRRRGRQVGTMTEERHPLWLGDRVSRNAARKRTRRMYPLGDCERCGKSATDRHHKDDNTANNHPSNVSILCRRCHMEVDGRLAALIAMAKAPRVIKPPRPCGKCDRPFKPLRRGLCNSCYERERRDAMSI